jgi:hypothetical protein
VGRDRDGHITLAQQLTARADRIRAYPVALAANIGTGEQPGLRTFMEYLVELNREAIEMVLLVAEAIDELRAGD